MSQSMNFHGVNAVRPLLINLVFAGGFQSDNFQFVSFFHKFPLFSGLCTMPASKYVSFSLVFALMGRLQGKVFLNPATVETACRTASRKVPELEGFHFHTLRHTYTTNLLSNGAQPKDVQELLGHSDVSTTMNVYAHATREAKRESAKLLDKVVGMN